MSRKPSPEYVSEVLQDYPKDHYGFEDKFFEKWLIKKYPKNDELNAVFAKLTLLDTLYSTNIRSAEARLKIVNFIYESEGFDERLKKGDTSLVSELTQQTKKLTGRECYSFSTKYCSLHNRDKFPIYDSFVDKKLHAYNAKYNFLGSKMSKNFLKNYTNLVQVIDKFRVHFKLEEFNYRAIDRFLWTLGKEGK